MTTRVPPYIRIAQRLRDEIIGGVIAPGDRLPSTRSLVDSEGVAKGTVDKAMARLRESGLVESVPGIGLVAVDHRRIDSPRDMFLRTVGIGPNIRLANEKSEFLTVGFGAAPERVASLMDIAAKSRVVQRGRLIRRSSQPAILATSWLPEWLGEAAPKLLIAEPIPQGTAVYVAEQTGRRIVRGVDRVKLAPAGDAFLMHHLGVSQAEPTLYVESTWYDDAGDVIEVGIYHYSAQGGRELSYEYEIEEKPS